jgi:hypothetical protein
LRDIHLGTFSNNKREKNQAENSGVNFLKACQIDEAMIYHFFLTFFVMLPSLGSSHLSRKPDLIFFLLLRICGITAIIVFLEQVLSMEIHGLFILS